MRIAAPSGPAVATQPTESGPAPSRSFDAAVAMLGLWFAGGVYLDGWAHTHGHVDQSFFTPWHAVLYSGYLSVAVLLAATALRSRRRGLPWRHSVPPGYELSLVGAAIFLAAGVGDMIWHILLGIETNVSALYSPTHLTLALGGVLMASGPLRSAWRRSGPRGDQMPLSAIASLLAILGVFTFFTQVAHPLVHPMAAGSGEGEASFNLFTFYQEALGVTSVILQSAILIGLILVALRRFVLPFGAFTLLLGANAFGLAFLSDQITGQAGGLRFVPAAIAAGLLADALYAVLRSSSLGRIAGTRVLATAVPVIFYLLYFLTLLATTGIWWPIPLWLGSIAIAGVAGLLLSYVALPPGIPPGVSRLSGDVPQSAPR